MTIFEDIIKRMTGAADYTVKKTEAMTDAAKIRMEIRTQKSRLARCYETIGRAYYKNEKGLTQDGGEALAAAVAEADDLRAQMHKLHEKLARAKNCVLCPHCGAQVPSYCVFCPMCGVKLPEPEEEVPAEEETVAETPAEETPDENAPAEEAPTEDAPAEDAPAGNEEEKPE